MNKKLVGALGVVVVLFGAVYLVFFRHRAGDAAPVNVHVIDEQKQPIANATVKAATVNDREVKTDDKGDARVEPIQPGWVSVEVNAAGYASNTAFTTAGSGGVTAQLAITLHKG